MNFEFGTKFADVEMTPIPKANFEEANLKTAPLKEPFAEVFLTKQGQNTFHFYQL